MFWVFDVEIRTTCILNAFRQFWIFLFFVFCLGGGKPKSCQYLFWVVRQTKYFWGYRLDAGVEPMYRQNLRVPTPVRVVKIKLAVGNELQMV